MFRFLIVIASIVFLADAEAENCFNYYLPDAEGIIPVQLATKCEVYGADTIRDPKRFRCILEAFQIIDDDETLNKNVLDELVKIYAFPKYYHEIREVTTFCAGDSVENFISCFPNRISAICPKDMYYGYPDGTK